MTDIEQLGKDLNNFEKYSINYLPAADQPVAKRILKAARAHMEAMKQKPVGYLVRRITQPVTCEFDNSDEWHFRKEPINWQFAERDYEQIKIYTSPPPAEQPVLKVPEIKYETLTGFDRGADAMRDKIIAMNPHLKVEES